jgi:hypothetical protein
MVLDTKTQMAGDSKYVYQKTVGEGRISQRDIGTLINLFTPPVRTCFRAHFYRNALFALSSPIQIHHNGDPTSVASTRQQRHRRTPNYGRHFMDTLPTIQKPRSGGAAVLRQHQASVITTTAIGHITDTNSPVVDSDAITDLQVAARGALKLPNLLPLHHPRHCCLNSTTSTRLAC